MGYNPTVTPQLPDSSPITTPQVGKVLSAIGKQTLSTKEIMGIIGLKDKSNFLELYLYPVISWIWWNRFTRKSLNTHDRNTALQRKAWNC